MLRTLQITNSVADLSVPYTWQIVAVKVQSSYVAMLSYSPTCISSLFVYL